MTNLISLVDIELFRSCFLCQFSRVVFFKKFLFDLHCQTCWCQVAMVLSRHPFGDLCDYPFFIPDVVAVSSFFLISLSSGLSILSSVQRTMFWLR